MSDFAFQAPTIENPEERRGFNLSALAVRQRSVTMFFLFAIVIAGVVTYLSLGRAEDPTFTIKAFTVTAAWPGATAEEMQDLVAQWSPAMARLDSPPRPRSTGHRDDEKHFHH